MQFGASWVLVEPQPALSIIYATTVPLTLISLDVNSHPVLVISKDYKLSAAV